MCCRTRYALKGVNGTFKNELMQGIMNWLCHEFSLCSMNCPKGHCGGKSIYFRCSPLFFPYSRGFLHAFHLVEMTIPKKHHLKRSPVIQSVAKHVIQRAYNARRNSWEGFISWEGTAYTPRRDDIQRLALMIYSHK